MISKNRKIAVAMSGGVDSSVAAALLVDQGYEVIGIMLELWSETGGADNKCCTLSAQADARFIAERLNIPFYVRDFESLFKSVIVDSFVTAYSQGLTPNPCLTCNRVIRFTHLLQAAQDLGADVLVTGHYARVIQNPVDHKFELWRGIDPAKDQSYVLHSLNQRTLPHAWFPLGDYTKPAVRAMAEDYGIHVFNKPDSQDLCFLGEGDYRSFLNRHAPQTLQTGDIINTRGEVIGQHQGYARYTIGQRKGLGIAYTEPLYVLRIDPIRNRIIVGTQAELGRDELTAHSVTYVSGDPFTGPTTVEAKTRYKVKPVKAIVTPLPNNRLHAKLSKSLPDITPGQGIVFYQGDKVLGGGVIEPYSQLPQ